MSDLKRGNLLWESSRMFLPEHKQALLQRKKQLKEVKKPELDEQELQEIGMVIMDSLHHELIVKITYWHAGFFYEKVGVVDKVDMQTKSIKIKVKDGFKYLDISSLKAVERFSNYV